MRKRKSFVRSEGVRSARLVVIAAEGRKTEKIYFEAMKVELCASKVHIEILDRNNNNSNPENVLAQIREYVSKFDIEDDDQLWLVIDKDHWQDKMLSSVALECQQNPNLKLCLSNPCFELWLILHLEDISTYNAEQMQALAENKRLTKNSDTWTKRRMKELAGHYNESDYDAYSLLKNINIAISRAKQLDVNPQDRWPQKVATRVYLLAENILGK